MGIFGDIVQHKRGFTIVELMIVVTIIAILVSIVVFMYPGYQARSRNNERKSDLTQLATALNTYAIQKNDYMTTASGCGRGGNGSGWVNAGTSQIGSYPKSIAKCLEEAGVVKSEDELFDPLGCRYDSGGKCGTASSIPTTAYMKASCTKSSKPVVYVMTYLENEPRKDAEVNALCDSGSLTGFTAGEQLWGTLYGMNYYVKVQ